MVRHLYDMCIYSFIKAGYNNCICNVPVYTVPAVAAADVFQRLQF